VIGPASTLPRGLKGVVATLNADSAIRGIRRRIKSEMEPFGVFSLKGLSEPQHVYGP
jgi:hypothetical protein